MNRRPVPPMTLPILPGIRWPRIASKEGQLMLALQFQLNEIQWWSAAEIRTRQLEQASRLVAHAWEHVPYYRPILEAAGYRHGGPMDPSSWSRIALLSRSQIQEAGGALLSGRPPAEHGKTHVGQTSGSTGAPIRFTKTELAQQFWRAFTLRDHLWHGRDFSGKLAVIRARMTKNRVSSWGTAVDCLYRTGPAVTLGLNVSIEEQLDWLREEQPNYLLTYPNILRELLLLSENRGLTLPNLRQVRTFAEALPAELRSLCTRVWGIKLADMYSSQEAGYLALQCPQHDHYHVQSEGVLLEVLDTEGNPCVPGEVGQVVVTPLHNFAMPMLRYAIGDYAEVGAPCPCGRGLPVLSSILGRERNMLVLPNGQRRWPVFGLQLYSGLIRQYQVVQKSLESIEVNLVTTRPLTAAENTELHELLIFKLGHPFRIEFSYRDSIPRAASGKFEDFRSELAGATTGTAGAA